MSDREKKRLEALESYQIMDSDIEQNFDDITKIASEICNVPIVLVSLVDENRQWFKSKLGLDVTQTPRDVSFCQHTILGTEILEVSNATEDSRFSDNPLVTGPPQIRFYAGAPLLDSDGFALGSLCVIDRNERELSESQKECLKALSRQVVSLMESRRRLLETKTQMLSRETDLQQKYAILENALALRAENLDYLFKSIPQIIWTADANGAIDLCNEKWIALTGLTYKETMGDGWLSAVHSDDVSNALLKWEHSLKTQTIYTNEMRFRDRTGEYRWFIVRGVPARESKNINTRWFGTCTDITEIKNAQSEKIELEVKAHAALEASRLKTEFLANMSHEIRTPINGIIGMANLLAETKLNTEQKKFTDIIVSSSKILLTLINDILDITKVEAGKLHFEEVPFDLLSLLNEIKTNFENQFKAKNLDFYCQFNLDESLSYVGDPARIQQIINNLLGNAIKFTQKGFVSFTVNHVIHIEHGSQLQFEIRDTGIGISHDVLPNLFTNFSQADTSTARKFGGSGLGLAISRRLAQNMGGDMQVESEVNKGAVFKFNIRLKTTLKSATRPVKQKNIVHDAARKKFRVLVVEDNMINQEITLRMLKKAGYRAEVVANGLEVLAAVSNINYDLILMDCQMPEMDGYEATKVLRARHFNAPIIALTANAFKEDREKCLSAGMNDFLTKPLDINHLIDALDQWLAVKLAS